MSRACRASSGPFPLVQVTNLRKLRSALKLRGELAGWSKPSRLGVKNCAPGASSIDAVQRLVNLRTSTGCCARYGCVVERVRLKSGGLRMRSYGQWIKMAVFGLAVVALAVTSVQAKAIVGRCCMRTGCVDGMLYKACRNEGGSYNANMTCASRPRCAQANPSPDRPD